MGILTRIDVVRGVKKSPLGWRDKALGITETQPEDDTLERTTKEADPPPGAEKSGGQTREQSEQRMTGTRRQFPKILTVPVLGLEGAEQPDGRSVNGRQCTVEGSEAD